MLARAETVLGLKAEDKVFGDARSCSEEGAAVSSHYVGNQQLGGAETTGRLW